MKTLYIGAIAYVLVGIVTFGHSAAETHKSVLRDYAECRASGEKYCIKHGEFAPAGGMLAAILWPLYWSWEAWS